jgi:CBS domain-containing protein
MKIKDTLDFTVRPKPITLSPDAKVSEALAIMIEKKIGSIVVVSPDNHVIGMVTERDMTHTVLAKKLDTETTLLRDIMSTHIRAAEEDDNLIDWMQTMSHQRFRHLPIIDKDKQLIGLMSQGDCLAFTFPDLSEKIMRDLKGRFSRWVQIFIIVFAVLTLGLIALGL